MSYSTIGLFAGLLLGVAAIGGFGYFILAVVLAAIGFVVGRVLDGELDLSPYLQNRDAAAGRRRP